MIRVTVELIKWGVGEPELLHEAIIYNDGSGSPERGNYKAAFGRAGQKLWPPTNTHEDWLNKPSRTSEVVNFPRKAKNSLHLLAQALKEAGYG